MPDQIDHFGGTLTFPTWTPDGFIREGKEDGVIFDMGTITFPVGFVEQHAQRLLANNPIRPEPKSPLHQAFLPAEKGTSSDN